MYDFDTTITGKLLKNTFVLILTQDVPTASTRSLVVQQTPVCNCTPVWIYTVTRATVSHLNKPVSGHLKHPQHPKHLQWVGTWKTHALSKPEATWFCETKAGCLCVSN